jgi:hypothetical protein
MWINLQYSNELPVTDNYIYSSRFNENRPEFPESQDLFRISSDWDQARIAYSIQLSTHGCGNGIGDYRKKVRKRQSHF